MSDTSLSQTPPRRSIPLRWLALILAVIVIATLPLELTLGFLNQAAARLPDFATIFLGIFIEAAPFLLFGTLASGLVEVFISQDTLARLLPRQPALGALAGGLLGLFFPVCECGVVPLTRRLLRKGLPLSTGIAFLLAAPVLNPIVILSTAAAFGFGGVLALRLALSLLIAVLTGLVFAAEPDPVHILRAVDTPASPVTPLQPLVLAQPASAPTRLARLRAALGIALDEFFEMGRFLIFGAGLAAGMQVFIPQAALLDIGSGPLASVLVMNGVAVLLSICSTVDAFVALGFVGTFSGGAILSFLVFGPMVDIKSVLMYGQVFRPRPVLYLVLIPFLVSLLAGLLINYAFPGLT